jgi:anaerobic ribonucleoside-triphosphate reductase
VSDILFFFFFWKIHKIFVKCAETKGFKSRFTEVQLQKKKKVLESIEDVYIEIEKIGTNFKFPKILIKNSHF